MPEQSQYDVQKILKQPKITFDLTNPPTHPPPPKSQQNEGERKSPNKRENNKPKIMNMKQRSIQTYLQKQKPKIIPIEDKNRKKKHRKETPTKKKEKKIFKKEDTGRKKEELSANEERKPIAENEEQIHMEKIQCEEKVEKENSEIKQEERKLITEKEKNPQKLVLKAPKKEDNPKIRKEKKILNVEQNNGRKINDYFKKKEKFIITHEKVTAAGENMKTEILQKKYQDQEYGKADYNKIGNNYLQSNVCVIPDNNIVKNKEVNIDILSQTEDRVTDYADNTDGKKSSHIPECSNTDYDTERCSESSSEVIRQADNPIIEDRFVKTFAFKSKDQTNPEKGEV